MICCFGIISSVELGFPGGSDSKESACNVGDLGWEDPLEEGMATHPSIHAWRIPMERGAWGATVYGVAKSQTGEPGGLQSMGSQRVRQG